MLLIFGLGAGGARGLEPTVARTRAALALAALLASAGCGGAGGLAPDDRPTPAPPPPKVAILSVDGLRPSVFEAPDPLRAEAPNILGLSRRGVHTFAAQTVFPSHTLPAHASMLSGTTPAVHGFTWNDYQPARGAIGVPTVFSIARAAGLRTVMVVGKSKLRHLERPDSVDAFVLAGRGDADVANEAVVQVQAGFDLLFVHFPDTDLSGHASGWLSPTYLARVADADAAVGRLLAALPAHTTVILSADHGGNARTHGSTSREDMTIPWVLAGPRVTRPGRELVRPVRTVDTAATALFVLGLTLPADAAGRVVDEAFEP